MRSTEVNFVKISKCTEDPDFFLLKAIFFEIYTKKDKKGQKNDFYVYSTVFFLILGATKCGQNEMLLCFTTGNISGITCLNNNKICK